jgi:DNA-binding NarL/FixJ family response regulator
MMAKYLRSNKSMGAGPGQGRETGFASPQAVLSVAIIEDQQDIRSGLQILINGWPGFRCAGAFSSMEEALKKLSQDVPQIVLVDIGLPGMSGTEGIPLIRERFPDTIALVLSVYSDDQRIFEALCAGACGYLLKKTPPAILLDSLREAAEGGAPMSPEIARRVVTLFQSFRPPNKEESDLTPHEVRLLKLLVEGHNYKTAAAELGVTVNTIAFHMKRIYEKLHVHSKSEAVAKALRNRIVQ